MTEDDRFGYIFRFPFPQETTSSTSSRLVRILSYLFSSHFQTSLFTFYCLPFTDRVGESLVHHVIDTLFPYCSEPSHTNTGTVVNEKTFLSSNRKYNNKRHNSKLKIELLFQLKDRLVTHQILTNL